MKLAEALIIRADLQKKIEQLRNRIESNARIQEGDTPNENPFELLKELDMSIIKLTDIIIRINKTNSMVKFNEELTIADALAKRDGIWLKRTTLSRIVDSGTIRHDRYSNTEVRFVSMIDVKKIQDEVDLLSKQFRELDTKIQGLNWNIDLI
nr:DIP1984 family protein [Tissierella sp.]